MAKDEAERCGRLIDHFVDLLRHPCCIPNIKINKLMTNFHRELIDEQIIIMIRDDIPSITYGFTPEGDYRCIILPTGWEEIFQKNPIMVFGGLIYVGSHANDLHAKSAESVQPGDVALFGIRAKMYEAEFYRTCDKIGLTYNKTGYQQTILDEYPTLIIDDLVPYKPGDFDFVESFYSKGTTSSIE